MNIGVLPMRERILDAAETRIRATGFHSVSFRDLAHDVGVKSASIHYHFPQKSDLGDHLVERYSARFHAELDAIDTLEPNAAITEFLAIYDNAFSIGKSICLCAILSAEANSLPESLNVRLRGFFELNVRWLSALNLQHDVADRVPDPLETVGALEGAMIVANAMSDRAVLTATITRIQAAYAAAAKQHPDPSKT